MREVPFKPAVFETIPPATFISSVAVADALGISHIEIYEDIQKMLLKEKGIEGLIIEVVKDDIGGDGMDNAFLMDLKAVLEWTVHYFEILNDIEGTKE